MPNQARGRANGAFAHWALDHPLWDVLVFVTLGLACKRRSPSRSGTTLGLAALAISPAIWTVTPKPTNYRGLSGLDAALFALLAVLVVREEPEPGHSRALRL